jgi:endoglucanase
MKILITLAFTVALMSCATPFPETGQGSSAHIRINQIGYYPDAIKEFVVADLPATSFQVMNQKGKKVYQGTLVPMGPWEMSGEEILVGDFSRFDTPGTYTLLLNTGDRSAPFAIGKDIFREAFNASIKSYYFQRASMAIDEAFGGIYARASGHPDLACPFHPSTGKESGTLDSPGGWYDAGDYGKYVGNASISMGQMLNLLELFPEAVADGRLNIPESGNGNSDLLDEIGYELDWVVTMQDSDGGVFHKLTARNFAGFIMPEDYDLERLIIGKGTCASLNCAAVMAQASRILRNTDPDRAKELQASALRAWEWSLNHPDVAFRNPKDVSTGEYGDDQFSDDFYWAAAELYINTGKERFLKYLVENEEPYVHQETNSWKYFIRNMGFHSLLANRDKIDPALAESLTKRHLELSDGILEKTETIPYHIGVDNFEWGSNSDVLNQAMILCFAHLLSGEKKYLDGAVRSVDYIFGKNATGYSFLTGYGSRQVMNPHHRPSGADGIEAPVPGFIVGGPNKYKQDRHEVEYASGYPAQSFEDVQGSYASNEVCLNWNAPAVFVMGYLEQQYSLTHW